MVKEPSAETAGGGSPAATTPAEFESVVGVCDKLRAEVGKVVIGMERITDLLLVCVLAGGHALMEGVPGVAKTTLAKTFAAALGLGFRRIQFTPDLLPGDITGSYVFNVKTNEFTLRPGPVFAKPRPPCWNACRSAR